MPPAVVTVTSTVPVPAGAVAMIDVAELTVKVVALAAPNFTAVAPRKLVPVIVMAVPPAIGPALGDSEVTAGAGMYVNWFTPAAEVPPAVVTVTSTVPVPGGAVAVIEVGELTVTPDASAVPNLTVVAPAIKPLPEIVTDVPPAAGPEVGEIPVTTGTAR